MVAVVTLTVQVIVRASDFVDTPLRLSGNLFGTVKKKKTEKKTEKKQQL